MGEPTKEQFRQMIAEAAKNGGYGVEEELKESIVLTSIRGRGALAVLQDKNSGKLETEKSAILDFGARLSGPDEKPFEIPPIALGGAALAMTVATLMDIGTNIFGPSFILATAVAHNIRAERSQGDDGKPDVDDEPETETTTRIGMYL